MAEILRLVGLREDKIYISIKYQLKKNNSHTKIYLYMHTLLHISYTVDTHYYMNVVFMEHNHVPKSSESYLWQLH